MNDDNKKQTLFQSRLNALNAECMNYFHQVHLRVTMIKIMIMIMIMIMITMMIKIIHSSNENYLQDISPSFYHVQKPKAFLRPIITNLGNECIDPNISAENRQRSVQWITTELRKQTARLDLMIKMTKTDNQNDNDKDVKFNRFLKESSREKQPYREQSVRPFCKTGWRNLIIFIILTIIIMDVITVVMIIITIIMMIVITIIIMIAITIVMIIITITRASSCSGSSTNTTLRLEKRCSLLSNSPG